MKLLLFFITILSSTVAAAQPLETAWPDIAWVRTTMPTHEVYTGGITPDGEGVVVGVGSSLPPGETRLFDLRRGLLLWRVPSFHSFSRYNSRANRVALVTWGDRQRVEVWDVAERRLVSSFRGDFMGDIYSLALSDNGRYVAASSDSALQVYDIAEERFVQSWELGIMAWGLQLSPSGRYLFGVPGRWGPEGKGRMFDVESGEVVKNLYRSRFQGFDVNVTFSPDERYIAFCGSFADLDYGVSIYTVPDCRPVREYFGSDDEFTRGDYWSFDAVAFSPDGSLLAGRYDPTSPKSLFWDVETGERLDSLNHSQLTPAPTVYDLGRDNRTLLLGSLLLGPLNAWDIKEHHLIADYFGTDYHAHRVTQARFSGSGKFVAVGMYVGFIQLYDAETGDTLLTIPHTEKPVWSVNGLDVSPDDSLIAVAGRDSLLTLYKSSTGEPVAVSENLGSPSGLVEFFGGGESVAVASERGITLFTTAGLQPVRTVPEPGTPLFALSPDGSAIVSVNSVGQVRLWDVESGSLRREIGVQQGGEELLWSPDGAYIALCAEDGSIRVWESATWSLYQDWRHGSAVHTIGFSPDAKFLVSGGEDSTLRVWSIVRGKEVYRYASFPVIVRRLEVSPDGSGIITTSFDVSYDHRLIMRRAEWPLLTVNERGKNVQEIELVGVYPQPASAICRVTVRLQHLSDIQAALYNLRGERIREWHPGWLSEGEQQFRVDITGLVSGRYSCRVWTAETEVEFPLTILQ